MIPPAAKGRQSLKQRWIYALPVSLLMAAGALASQPDQSLWGRLDDGRVVHLYHLSNARGMTVELTDLGAAIVAIRLQRKGGARDMVVGPQDFAGFAASRRRFGAIVGRYAGRLGRSVPIGGRTFQLNARPDGVTLHGGDPGFDRMLWTGRPFAGPQGRGVEFTLVSPAGMQNLPGTLTVKARYVLAPRQDRLSLTITAWTDRPTIANLTNHVYFNLSDDPTIAGHCLAMDARREVEIDDRKLPTGRLRNIIGSAHDFRRPSPLAPIVAAGGMDDMFVLERNRVRLSDPKSGETLTITTSEPGVQVYTGNGFDGTDRDRRGCPIAAHAGIALETQHFPDSPNQKSFPSTLVTTASPMKSWTAWTFENKANNYRQCRHNN